LAWAAARRSLFKARAGGEAMLSGEAISKKLAAILAADAAAYSRLMEADEEGMLARLKSCAAI
jgi:class 3 adenylate cyclase